MTRLRILSGITAMALILFSQTMRAQTIPIMQVFEIQVEPIGTGTLDLDPNGNLVVSNIGSSGQDGVRFIAPPEIPIPSTGRFIPPRPNFEASDQGALVRFDQIGGLGGPPGQVQSFFQAANNQNHLEVQVGMGLGQSQFFLELFQGNRRVGQTFLDSTLAGNIQGQLATEVVDLVSYDIIVPSPDIITLTGTLARPTQFFLGGNPLLGPNDLADRAVITNVDNTRSLSSFESIDLSAANTPIQVADVLLIDNAPKTFDNIPIVGLGQGQPATVLNRNGQLVVSNIGSSGQDGVRFIAPPTIPIPSTGRFIPPVPNFSASQLGAQVRFDQIGGLDGDRNALQSQFISTNTGTQLQVDVTLGLGQNDFILELFDGNMLVQTAQIPSTADGHIQPGPAGGGLATGIEDLISYDVIVPDPNTITLTGTLARPTTFSYDGNVIGVGDRAVIRNADGNRRVTGFESIDLRAANTDISVNETMILQETTTFNNIPVVGLGNGQPAVALNRDGQLVVSNIGSSGEDGVRFVAPPNIPIPGTGRFIPPNPNFSTTGPGTTARFDQIGGLDGVDGQLQSQFMVHNTGDQLSVDVSMGLGQTAFNVELFDPDGNSIIRAQAPADPATGQLAVDVSTSVVDLSSYDIIVMDPRTLRLTGSFEDPIVFTIGSQTFPNVGRATITNADNTRRLTSFESIDIRAADTPARDLRVDDVVIVAPGPVRPVKDGFDIRPLGGGEISLQGSNLVVSNIGSSGEDGVRFIPPDNLQIPSTGRFIPPPNNFEGSDPDDSIRFDQIGGLDGEDLQLQSQFMSTNTGDRLKVDVRMGLGQNRFMLEIFDGDTSMGTAFLDAGPNGEIQEVLETEIVDLISYDIIVPDIDHITLTGALARPSRFFLNDVEIGTGDRATITNADGTRQLSSFGSIDIFASNTNIAIAEVLTIPASGFQWATGGNNPTINEHSTIAGNTVNARGEIEARSVTVRDNGRLTFDGGVLTTDTLTVHRGSATAGVGTLVGNLASSGNHFLVAVGGSLLVTGTANFDGGEIRADNAYPQIGARGTLSGEFLGLQANGGIIAPSFNQPGDHLGNGIFLESIRTVGDMGGNPTQVFINTLSARQGDLDGSQDVSVLEAFTVVGNLRQTNQDFTGGDENGNGEVEVVEAFTAVGNLGSYTPDQFGDDVALAAQRAESASLVYNRFTGNLSVEDISDESLSLRGMLIETKNISFAKELDLPEDDALIAISNDLSLDDESLAFSTLPLIKNIFGNGHDFGNVLPAHLTQPEIDSELTVLFQREVDGLGIQFSGSIQVVPEPSAVLLILIGMVGIVARRRR